MPEISKTALTTQEDASVEATFCTGKYDLHGPQVEPEASYWLTCPAPRVITLDELIARTQDNSTYPDFFREEYPTNPQILKAEIEELIQLARLRDEPNAFPHEPTHPITVEPQQKRQPLSMFLQLRPQPLGAVINTARGDAFPVIATGRELARYFENETPGLQFQLALDYMIRERFWSPPRQARAWAALNVTIFSALQAAWFYKWWAVDKNRHPIAGIADRPRPWECYKDLDVLFDRVPNSTNSADAETRGLPMGVQPLPPKPGVPVPPEMQVADILTPTSPSQKTPGTPRHPAYPSGHSTYSAAAAEILRYFFPEYSEQLTRLADNTGLARLWAGVHWRSDHTFGQRLGRAVASLIIEQLDKTHIAVEPGVRPPDETPKTVAQITVEAPQFKTHCG
jgi:membrane-associated phospholipid phosphatase